MVIKIGYVITNKKNTKYKFILPF
ncbi:ribosomal protein S17 [Toxoplasma gondii CAST]|nr:ribosomal protein S17 [Toxoplasma gondii CAST]